MKVLSYIKCLLVGCILLYMQNGYGILHVYLKEKASGSMEVALSHCAKIAATYHNVTMVVSERADIVARLKNLTIPYILIDKKQGKKEQINRKQFIEQELEKICISKNIRVLAAHKSTEYGIVKKVAQKLQLPAVAFYHVGGMPDLESFRGYHSFVAVSPRVACWAEKKNKELGIGLNHIYYIPPSYNEDRIKDFVPSGQTVGDFFKKNFNITLTKDPIVSIIANLYSCKNHELAIRALHKLSLEGKPFQLLCAGADCGNLKNNLMELARDLKVEQYVHFLGYAKQVPDILYYSDVMLLPSKREAFGIVLLEAGLMHKPVITTFQNGSSGFLVKHNRTGLLCDAYKVDDCVCQIKKIISNYRLANKLGDALYKEVICSYSNQKLWEKEKDIYKNLIV